jgi:hypothetical protein
MDIRERARIYLLQVPPPPAEIRSNGVTAPLFTRLTGGMTQAGLQQNWNSGGKQTSCNSFVANYAGDAGIGIGKPGRSLGQFGLDNKVAGWGKGFAWVAASPGARPKFGDIFEIATSLHQGVSLDFVGGTWNTAEGGQGGPSLGFDIIKRKALSQGGDLVIHPRGPLKGWVDIDLFANGPPPTTMPGWLLGWWAVPWRARIFYYFFEESFKASWTFTRPISNALAPMRFDDTAVVTIDGPQSVTLKWSATGSVEKFAQSTSSGEMLGTWNGTEPLLATKLF